MVSTILLIVFGAVLLLPFVLFAAVATISALVQGCDDSFGFGCGCTLVIAAAIGSCLLWIGIDRLIGG